MLHIAASGLLINLERQGLMKVFPDTVRKLWKAWQLRALVMSSLGLQVALILSGKRRKRTGYIWFRLLVWSTYLLADWVATLALGVIANNIKVPNKGAPVGEDLMSLWAPFLLVHLGGPDTITAYSLEDNELWQRRTLELITQTTVTLYIFVIAWPRVSYLSILTIPMLIVGLIKFGERIAALRSASSENFRDSLLTPPDPGPNYAKFMEDFTLRKAEGFYVTADLIAEASTLTNPCEDTDPDESVLLVKAFKFFQMFKRLFVDLILSFEDRDESQSFFSGLGSDKAFQLIRLELGLIYDAFYTKAPVVYSSTGIILRFITVFLTSTVLILFRFITSEGKQYHTTDRIITYILMGGAIVLEMVALVALLFSDWTRYWLSKHDSKVSKFLLRCISRRKPEKRWSASMAQYSLLDVCLKEERAQLPLILKLLTVNKRFKTHICLDHSGVSHDLEDLIFRHCREMSEKIKDSNDLMKLCRSRGDYALKPLLAKDKEQQDGLAQWDWSMTTTKVEFDQSILIWHIATQLCYHCDTQSGSPSVEMRESKHLADYMLYLLAMCPFMLPVGIGLIRFRDTCAEAKEFFKNKNLSTSDLGKACKMLLRVNTEVSPSQVKGDRSKSVLFDACKLATMLRGLGPDRKWNIISLVWVEILGYAAIHCRGAQHAQQLRKGGELLTHVWFLMAHLGITEQLQISQGHARAKLNAK